MWNKGDDSLEPPRLGFSLSASISSSAGAAQLSLLISVHLYQINLVTPPLLSLHPRVFRVIAALFRFG